MEKHSINARIFSYRKKDHRKERERLWTQRLHRESESEAIDEGGLIVGKEGGNDLVKAELELRRAAFRNKMLWNGLWNYVCMPLRFPTF